MSKDDIVILDETSNKRTIENKMRPCLFKSLVRFDYTIIIVICFHVVITYIVDVFFFFGKFS